MLPTYSARKSELADVSSGKEGAEYITARDREIEM
jgi:hypothetical protein